MPTKATEIHIKQLELRDEKDPIRRQKLVIQLEIAQLQQQIEMKRASLEQLKVRKDI
jgi:hypothetical protein